MFACCSCSCCLLCFFGVVCIAYVVRKINLSLRSKPIQLSIGPKNVPNDRCPHQLSVSDNVVVKSASFLAAQIRSGKLTSVELVGACISQVRAVNGAINAAVEERFEAALEEAREADEKVTGCGNPSSLPPFHGVPCSIKAAFSLAGLRKPHSGVVSIYQSGGVSTEDATTVHRLRQAGFVPICQTNVSELCMWWESSNFVHGITRNPYDYTKIVGGSSGGEGAIVTACGAPVGLGSDIGGSIRLPSFYNGIFGHKPSGGLVPSTGQFPCTKTKSGAKILTSGPMVRHAEDLWPMLKVLAGPDGKDIGCEDIKLIKSPTDVNLDDVTIYTLGGKSATRLGMRIPVPSLAKNIQQGVQDAVRAITPDVKQVVELEGFKHMGYGLDIWSSCMADASNESFKEQMEAGGSKMNLMCELLKNIIGLSNHTLPAIGLALFEPLSNAITDHKKMLKLRDELKEEIERTLGDSGVLIIPTQPRVSPQHNHPLRPNHIFSFPYTALFNALHLPVTQCPIGLDTKTGLPLGLQVVGKHGNDHLCIAIALQLEKRMGGWVPPKMAEKDPGVWRNIYPL